MLTYSKKRESFWSVVTTLEIEPNTNTKPQQDPEADYVGDSGLFSGPAVRDEHGIRRYGKLPAVVHHRAEQQLNSQEEKLGSREARSKYWSEDHRRVMSLISAEPKFRQICRDNQVAPGTVIQYNLAVMQDSDRFGKDIATGTKKLAERIGKSVRQMHRARKVARVVGFELFAIRAWQEPNEGNTYKRTSTLVRPMIPKRLAKKVRKQRSQAAAQARAARRKKTTTTTTGRTENTTGPTKTPVCATCNDTQTVPTTQPDGTTLAAWCPTCGPP